MMIRCFSATPISILSHALTSVDAEIVLLAQRDGKLISTIRGAFARHEDELPNKVIERGPEIVEEVTQKNAPGDIVG